jgi:hypothetical protein
MILGSRPHTAGDTRRWILDYSRWLDNTAIIVSATITSDSDTLTVTDPPTVLGREIVFYLNGGVVGETAILTIVMTDSFENIKTDTLHMTVLAP